MCLHQLFVLALITQQVDLHLKLLKWSQILGECQWNVVLAAREAKSGGREFLHLCGWAANKNSLKFCIFLKLEWPAPPYLPPSQGVACAFGAFSSPLKLLPQRRQTLLFMPRNVGSLSQLPRKVCSEILWPSVKFKRSATKTRAQKVFNMRIALIKYVFHLANPERRAAKYEKMGKSKQRNKNYKTLSFVCVCLCVCGCVWLFVCVLLFTLWCFYCST